jgi:Rrf2 family nitric oxide-sensitive transcriptional repressor
MRLTTFTDYSLRVLIYLALDQKRQPTIGEISARYGISKNHLMKVVQQLSQLGYVQALRGKHGGLQLKKPPGSIPLGTLIKQTENELNLAECFASDNQCILTPACKLQNILRKAMQAFFTSLDQYTLADIISGKNKAQLVALLQLD